MLQQGVCQQDQAMSNQQQSMGQQMVLCPVRFVYETQILMQPGDQIHPNQAILINPQNPPPWIQNRQVTNPILYVQQMPNNIMPSAQQHIDQNQMYMQQIANYQMPQMIQNQEQIKPNIQMMQMANISTNMQAERNVGQTMTNFSQTNNQMQHNQILIPNRQMVNVGNQNTIYAQSELQRQLFMNVRPVNQTRPMAVNPTQNVNVQQNMNINVPVQQNFNYGQTFAPNIGPRPQIHSNIKTEVVDKTEVSIANVIAPPRNVQNYPYKPIQPKPQFRTMYSNTLTQTPVHMAAPNISTNVTNTNKIMTNQVTPKVNYYINTMDNNALSRKRKSESPDEIQKKISINSVKSPEPLRYGSMTVKTITKSIDIGVNTSPVHKVHANKTQNAIIPVPAKPQEIKLNPIVYPNPSTAQINDNKPKTIENTVHQNIITTEAIKTTEIPQNFTADDKLIRKTVFTQAKGRVLNDKDIRPNTIENMQQNLDDFNKMRKISDEANEHSKMVSNTNSTQFNDFIKPAIPPKRPQNNNTDIEELKKVEPETNLDVTLDKKNQPNEFETKHEKDFVLTHVLDGFVIQESNIAFPIRKPLKEKTLQANAQDLLEQQNIEDTKAGVKEELANDGKTEEVPVMPFHCLQLDKERKDSDTKEENTDNPFGSLQQSTVKNWTMEQMSSHLVKYGWSETVSLLQDQEIDGESLLLVTKSQLIQIGVKETHADMICEFVRS